MTRAADLFKDYLEANPFNDIQGRNFSDEKIIKEFQPISKFWTLFNNQHEVIIGTRGSGKTFLLKMMRRSMLRRINHPTAKSIVSKKEYLSLYVPMHLEFVKLFSNEKFNDAQKNALFLLMFNCNLAHSLLLEIQDYLKSETGDKEKEIKLTARVCSYIGKTWFGRQETNLYTITSLLDKVNDLFYSIDLDNPTWNNTPTIFRRQLCAPLLAIKDHLEALFDLSSPTWIICIDEAEFLNETIQKIINGILRSDSNSIAIKIATLPFRHDTLATTEPGISIGEGQDFVYNFIDLNCDSKDFIDLTNKLCKSRLNGLIEKSKQIEELKDFLGFVGSDKMIDYYRLEFGEDNTTEKDIEAHIVSQFSPQRREGSESYANRKQTIIKKYAPVLFVREMYNKSKKGNTIPGWYAGADMVRKISQGNPRLFIQLMHALFEKARETSLEPKTQHEVLFRFARIVCDATKSLETKGPIIGNCLDNIAKILHDRVHGEYIMDAGASFSLVFNGKTNCFEKAKTWIQLAIAHSGLIVDDEVKKSGIEKDTVYLLSNSYAAKYWLPMRKGALIKIKNEKISSGDVKTRIRTSTRETTQNDLQTSIWDNDDSENE